MPNIPTFLIYLIAGLLTGWQIFQAIMWAVWGAPTYSLEYVGLVSAWAIDIAGIIVFKRKKASLILATLGFIGLWSFYAPAIHQAVHEIHHLPPNTVAVDSGSVFIVPTLLIGATIYFMFDFILYVHKLKLVI